MSNINTTKVHIIELKDAKLYSIICGIIHLLIDEDDDDADAYNDHDENMSTISYLFQLSSVMLFHCLLAVM